MASSPAVSDDSDAAAASDPIAVAPTIQSQTAIPAVHEEVSSRSAGTKRRRRHLRPVVPAAAAAADAQAELQQARSQMAQVLAAIVALRAEMASFRNHVDARRMEMLAAIAAINDLCRLLRFLHGGSTK